MAFLGGEGTEHSHSSDYYVKGLLSFTLARSYTLYGNEWANECEGDRADKAIWKNVRLGLRCFHKVDA